MTFLNWRTIEYDELDMQKILSVSFLILISLWSSSQKTFAEQISIGAYPPRIIFDASPSDELSAPLEVQNFSEVPVTLSVSFQQFRQSESENGTINFIENTEEFRSFLKNIELTDQGVSVQRLLLAPKQKKSLNLQISIDSNPQPKDYNFSIVFTTSEQLPVTDDIKNTRIHVYGSVAVPVLLTIGNQHTQEITIEKFSTFPFVQNGPVPFILKVHNASAQRAAVTGTLNITNMFGQKIGKIVLPKTYILGESSRYILNAVSSEYTDYIRKIAQSSSNKTSLINNIIWGEKVLLGPYAATISLSVNDSATLFTRTIYFFALPYSIIIGLILGIVFFLFLRKRVKRYLEKN